MTWDLQKHRFMVSPCGNLADYYDEGSLPDGWTDCTDMSDAAIASLMERRWWASSK